MDLDTAIPSPKSSEQREAWRYSPSWYDRLSAWLENLPGPTALYYIGLGVALILILFGLTGPESTGGDRITDRMKLYLALIIPYVLASAHLLDTSAVRAIEKLRPALRLNEVSIEQMQYRIATLPARPALLASLVSIAAVHAPLLFGYDYLGIAPDPRIASQLAFFLIGILFWWVFGFAAYHTIHQLRAVSQIYSEHVNINLYRFSALYTLSTVTSITSIGILLAVSVAVALLPSIALQPIGLVVIGISLILAVITFAWPLWGVHRIMVEEKERMDLECSERYELLLKEWHSKVDSRKLDGSSDLYSAIQSVLAERDEIGKIPTWPWTPGTLRGWIAALFLPLAVWMLQWLIERFLLGG
jgi:hypothetical protein